MRRLAMLCIAALALSAAFSAAAWTARGSLVSSVRLAGQILDRAQHLAAGTALAQGELEFKPLPPESVSALERARTRRTAVPAIPPAPASPQVPQVPQVPQAPAAPTLDVVGKSGDMMRIGQDIHIEKDQHVIGDVVSIRGDIIVDGHVEGDVAALGGDVYLNSTARVDGDVAAVGGKLHEESGALVGGERVTALGPGGGRYGRHVRVFDRDAWDRHEDGGGHFGAVLWFLVGLGLAWGIARLAPGRTGAALQILQQETGMSLLVGLLWVLLAVPGFIVVALLAALLCITLVGIPVAIVALLAYPSEFIALWVWGYAIGVAAIGQRLTAKPSQPPTPLARAAFWGALLPAGAMTVAAIFHWLPGLGLFHGLGTLIEVITWIVAILASIMGLGALLRHEFTAGSVQRWWSGRRRPAVAVPGDAAVGVASSAAVPTGSAPSPSPPSDYMPRPPSGDPPAAGGPGSPPSATP